VSGILHVSREFRGKVAAPGGGHVFNRALVELDFCRLSVFDLLKQVVGPVKPEKPHSLSRSIK
jgi:hypothetical protein